MVYKFSFLVIAFSFLLACRSVSDNIQSQSGNISEDQLVMADVSLNLPEGWSLETPDNSMRIAQIAIPADSGTLAVFFFGQQDMVQQNIDRWKGQFASVETFEGLPITTNGRLAYKITGTYKKKATPMAQEYTEVPDYGVLAAIVKTEEGPYYIKYEGLVSVIEKNQEAFIDFIE